MGGCVLIICIIGIICNLCKDTYIHNSKVLGTDKDIFMKNPERMRNLKATQEIINKKS